MARTPLVTTSFNEKDNPPRFVDALRRTSRTRMLAEAMAMKWQLRFDAAPGRQP